MSYASRRYVIGQGLSAFAFAFYHPEYTLICTSEKKDSPFVFLNETSYSRRLVDDIGIPHAHKSVRLVRIIPSSPEKIIEDKKLSPKKFVGTGRIGNIGKNFSMYAIDSTESYICEWIKSILESDHRIINGKVLRITKTNIIMEHGEQFPYDEVICTKHFLEFKNLYEGWFPGDGIETQNLTYKLDKYDPELGCCIKYFDSGPTIRVINNAINDLCGYEIRSGHESEFTDAITIEHARVSGKLAPYPEKIVPIGRFATANGRWKIEDSIFVAQEGYSLYKMMLEQQRFDYYLHNAIDVSDEERIARLILHAHSELSELLRETNWKMNIGSRTKKSVKATSILEEGIDVIKLIMAIFCHFQYTPLEISEMFRQKSDEVWEGFLESFYGGV